MLVFMRPQLTDGREVSSPAASNFAVHPAHCLNGNCSVGWLSIFKMTDTFIDGLNIDDRADSK